jgi:hypothetical protein
MYVRDSSKGSSGENSFWIFHSYLPLLCCAVLHRRFFGDSNATMQKGSESTATGRSKRKLGETTENGAGAGEQLMQMHAQKYCKSKGLGADFERPQLLWCESS